MPIGSNHRLMNLRWRTSCSGVTSMTPSSRTVGPSRRPTRWYVSTVSQPEAARRTESATVETPIRSTAAPTLSRLAQLAAAIVVPFISSLTVTSS